MLRLGIEPGYVLDRMEVYEIRALLKHQDFRHREDWEQARMLAYVNARCAGSKINRVKEIFELPWDDERPDADTAAPTHEEEERLKKMANWYEQNGLPL